jgi:hypothetical protein
VSYIDPRHRKRLEERQDLTLQASMFNVPQEELVGITTAASEDGIRQPTSPTSELGSDDHSSFARLPLPPYKMHTGVSFAALLALKENHWANFFGAPLISPLPDALDAMAN